MKQNAKKKGAADESVLPSSVERAWGRSERAKRGPKRGLSVAEIVVAARAVASEEGLGKVSMSRVASRLGAATMALYRYVATKDELLALMVDSAFSDPPSVRSSRESWRSAMARWAQAHMAVLRREPWIVRVPIGGPPILPNQLVWFERGLGALAGTGLAEAEKVSVLILVDGFVRNAALLESDLRAAAAARPGEGASYAEMLETLVDRERFPALAAAIDADAFGDEELGDGDFDFGLERVLDGIGALVASRA